MSRKFSPGHCRLPLMASALALALAVTDVQALGLGGLRVQSALNQPFVGEIALLDVKPDELDTVKVQIASVEEFRKAGSERYHYLTQLRFSPQISPRGETVVRISSREPLREPYMDLLLEVTWPKGRLVKGYAVLLDPPATDGRRPSRIEQPVVSARSAPATARGDSGPADAKPAVRQRPASPPPAVQPAPVPAALAASAGGFPKQIGPVPRGAGLWRLAVNNTPAGATAAQTAMALYRNSQHAFVRGDINRLIAGKTLVIPNAAELFALGPEAAQREFAAALRGETVRRAPIADPTPAGPVGESRLRIAGTAPEEPAPERLAAPAAAGQGAMEQELLLVRETSESTRQETAELRGRIRELETQLGEIQQLLRLRNAELARIQSAAAPVAAAQPGEGETKVSTTGAEGAAPIAGEPAVETPPPASVLDAVADRSQEPALAASGDAATPGVEAEAQPAISEGPLETVELPLPVAESGMEEPAPAILEGAAEPSLAETPLVEAEAPDLQPADAPAERPVEALKPSPAGAEGASPPATDAEPSLAKAPTGGAAPADQPLPWADLLVPLASAAGVTLLGIGALGWVRARRRRSKEASYLEPEDLGLVAPPAATPSASRGQGAAAPAQGAKGAGGASELPPAPVVAPSVFSALGRSQAESDEADVLSEADIYIAYGRYREAEELLREEIERTPERVDLKYKLAESYHGARNYPALDGLMKEMQATGADRLDPERWQRLVDMAKAIEGLERADAGIRANPLRPASATVGLVDRGGPRSSEALSLDIGDSRLAAAPFGHAGDLDDTPGSAGDPSQRDVPVLRSSRPAPPALDDLGPLSLDLDVLPHSLDLDANADAAGLDAALGQEEGDLLGAVSDLELTIDDLRAASDLDLESFVDSTRTVTNLVDEPLSRHELTTDFLASHPAKLRAVTTEGTGGDGAKALGGSLYGPDEEGSSDLLSSQWQMDSGLWDETATKLDLARAYMEMGDQDSARGILEEVTHEGNEEQRSEAAQMLQALG
ncbi:MAG: FimV/HubP family polar landmark protein [Bdellovibrio bacteriovorus]